MKREHFFSALALCALLVSLQAPSPGIAREQDNPFQALFPVNTKQMQLSIAGSIQKMMGLEGAVFFIGDDHHSRSWLSKRRRQLVKEKAKGLVVQVPSKEKLAELRSLAPELQMVPVHIDQIIDYFGIRVYPSLLLGGGP